MGQVEIVWSIEAVEVVRGKMLAGRARVAGKIEIFAPAAGRSLKGDDIVRQELRVAAGIPRRVAVEGNASRGIAGGGTDGVL